MRRIRGLPHCFMLPLLCQCLPLVDEIRREGFISFNRVFWNNSLLACAVVKYGNVLMGSLTASVPRVYERAAPRGTNKVTCYNYLECICSSLPVGFMNSNETTVAASDWLTALPPRLK